MSYAKLRGKIREVYKTEKAFAQAMGMTRVGLSMRLNNKTKWTLDEAAKAKELLCIEDEDLSAYFFTPIVHNL